MRILIFLGLKVLEISAVVFIPYGIGWLLKKIPLIKELFDGCPCWLAGMIAMLASIAVIAVIIVLIDFFTVNWYWAGLLCKP